MNTSNKDLEPKNSPTFRSPTESIAKYEELEKTENRGRPYCITYENPSRYFTFLGVTHTNDSNHPQWPRYISEWDKFLSSPNPKKIVFYEGFNKLPEANTMIQALEKGGDPGLAIWLADRSGIKYECPEPDPKKEIDELKTEFSEDEIMIYYIGRQLRQWLRKDSTSQADRDEYIQKTINRYQDIYKDWNKIYTTEKVIDLIEKHLNKNISQITYEDLMKIDSPFENSVSALSSRIRDESIYSALKQAWDNGADVFCVFGSGHAITIEPALRDLFENE